MNENAIDESTVTELMKEAHKARDRAYAPYSRFNVGAALLFDDGIIVSGCNVENVSYGLSLCAERNAMTTAVSLGKKSPVAAAVVGEKGRLCPPCGACRQFLAEFNPNMIIILEQKDAVMTYKLSELLPISFSENDMEAAQ